MISATDSFINYLSTELNNNPKVAWMRVSPDSKTSGDFTMDALNVSILHFQEHGSSENILISLDLIGSDERNVLVWAKIVRDKLIERQYTPELDYAANPTAPTNLGKFVEWDGRDVTFSHIISRPHFYHLNATFVVSHVR